MSLEGALTGKKLGPRLCIMVQFMYRYAPCRLHICDVRGLIATPMCRQEACEEKFGFYRNLVLLSSLLLQTRRRKGTYPYMDCTTRKSLDTSSCMLNESHGFTRLWPIPENSFYWLFSYSFIALRLSERARAV